MKKISAFLGLITIIIPLLAVSCGKTAPDKDQLLCARLDSLFEPIFPDNQPGAVVVVERGDSIVYDRAFGLARLDPDVALTDSTPLCIASVSKQFAAIAVLKLRDQGLLSLDDSITRFFPNLPEKVFKDVRLHHLLSHTSGIPDKRPREQEQWEEYLKHHKSPFTSLQDYKRYSLWDESCAYMEFLDSLNFAPGTAYEYQNPTYQLLLPLVEKVTGQDFESWMKANIFEPAGMSRTRYYEPDNELDGVAHGYLRDRDGQWTENDYGEGNFFPTKADGALYTTARDFLKWQHALYEGRIVADATREEAHTSRIATDLPYESYGYGFYILQEPGRPRKIFHTGDNGGFYLYEARIPELDLNCLVFAVQPYWSRSSVMAQMDDIINEVYGANQGHR